MAAGGRLRRYPMPPASCPAVQLLDRDSAQGLILNRSHIPALPPWRCILPRGIVPLLALYCAGCAAAAATQVIPLVFQAATFTGVSVGSAVTGHDPTEDTEDTGERCDALAATPPYMGELIHTPNGEAVRGLILGEQGGKTKWF